MQLGPARAQISPSRAGQICEIRTHLFLSAPSNAPFLQRKYGPLGSEALEEQLFSILTHTGEPKPITQSEKTEPEVYRPAHALGVLPYLPKAPHPIPGSTLSPHVLPDTRNRRDALFLSCLPFDWPGANVLGRGICRGNAIYLLGHYNRRCCTMHRIECKLTGH
ncbi:hypothetical protein VTN02DRAFT_4323 [Thermoascus thermophilus]